jgi:hypothetical protein
MGFVLRALHGLSSTDSTRSQPHTALIAHNVRNSVGAWWILRSSALGLALAAASGCAAESQDDAVPSIHVDVRPDVQIFGGQDDDDPQATSSVVALKVARDEGFELCSGAVVAPNVILTARHCIATTITTTVSCDATGHSTNGLHVASDLPADHVSVYTGAAPKFGQKPAAVASAFVAPQGDYLCDSDIALVVLDRPLEGLTPIAVRLAGGVAPGETIRSVGYGQNDKSMPIGTRFRRPGVAVLAMGAGISKSQTALGAHEFEVGESICEGDSGGPAISETTGAVIGVVSRGGRCDDQAGHIYTTTAGWAPLFESAFALAGNAPIMEKGASATAGSQDGEGSTARAGASGCSTSRPVPTSSGSLAAAAAALIVLCRRRGRREKA